jgi:hypothetical protein
MIQVENGTLSYYKLKGPSESDKVLKGSFSLRGYSIQKTPHEMYVWCSRLGQEGKDLRLHPPDGFDLNKYPMKIWVAAIRAHIRYAHETYYPKLNWYPFYLHVMQDPKSVFDKKKLFQVVRRDGAAVEADFEDKSSFKSFKRYQELVEITEIRINTTNNCRGKLSNDEGWVTISTLDGSLILMELLLDAVPAKRGSGSVDLSPTAITDSMISVSNSIISEKSP